MTQTSIRVCIVASLIVVSCCLKKPRRGIGNIDWFDTNRSTHGMFFSEEMQDACWSAEQWFHKVQELADLHCVIGHEKQCKCSFKQRTRKATLVTLENYLSSLSASSSKMKALEEGSHEVSTAGVMSVEHDEKTANSSVARMHDQQAVVNALCEMYNDHGSQDFNSILEERCDALSPFKPAFLASLTEEAVTSALHRDYSFIAWRQEHPGVNESKFMDSVDDDEVLMRVMMPLFDDFVKANPSESKKAFTRFKELKGISPLFVRAVYEEDTEVHIRHLSEKWGDMPESSLSLEDRNRECILHFTSVWASGKVFEGAMRASLDFEQ